MVEVSLGQEYGADGAGIHGVEDTAVQGPFEPHARVDDDAAIVGGEKIGVRQPGGQPDPVAEIDGRLTPGGADGVGARPLAVDPRHGQ